jgi:hypothetical protein
MRFQEAAVRFKNGSIASWDVEAEKESFAGLCCRCLWDRSSASIGGKSCNCNEWNEWHPRQVRTSINSMVHCWCFTLHVYVMAEGGAECALRKDISDTH